ncbi:unnamed protein product (mitochondrion) [Plasmodiophora brassicae]|uniref:Pre-mRNA-splicing factor SYF1 n=1 Tax=Plasmodiophora brassicae TaxID=37360 RepID=A0A0G4IK75_PLABS|nr:hypothetical protein PBRA_004352 [Plasmodiophora brassicae]SPR00493.1 unnamed protein product [Plasmodiophora brassicae]
MADWSVFEVEVQNAPTSVNSWVRYLEARHQDPLDARRSLYERALHALPLSYKIWVRYLRDLVTAARSRDLSACADDAADAIVAFERAVAVLSHCPVLWMLYAKFLWAFGQVTKTRLTFDRALQSLPVTQHHHVWRYYTAFAANHPALGSKVHAAVPDETAVRIFRRYVHFEPSGRSQFADVLRRLHRYSDLMQLLADLVNDDDYVPEHGKTRLDLWNELCRLLVEHADAVPSTMSADAVLRSGMQRYSAETGALWVSLAHYYVRLGQFEKARDIFEEAMDTLVTIRDFTVVFDAYASYEESMLAAKMEADDDAVDDDDDFNIDGDDVDLRLMRLENLMNRRPLLVNSVLLRQNPYSVGEWLKRVRIVGEDDDEAALRTYVDAIDTIRPAEADGKLSQIWVGFAGLYERSRDVDSARVVFERAVAVQYRTVEELADVWCAWVEMELRLKNFQTALDVVRRATAAVPEKRDRAKADAYRPVQERVWRSTKLWSLRVDLEESVGSLESARAAYDRMIELKVATPQTILNFAALLESHRFFEDAFRAYEKGLARFEFPHAMLIWKTYLTKFVQRYGGKKLERARELFEQAVEGAPADSAKVLYLMYAKLEEDFGLARHALQIYDRAVQRVKDDDKLELFQIYVNKAGEFFGVTRTREVYEKAIATLPRALIRHVCLQYAQLETRLGEVDRVRALYTYCSQFCNPNTDTVFWQTFHDFEVQHGNEDTFREMLRVRRTVAADMAQTHFVSATLAQANALAAAAGGESTIAKNEMEALEMQAEQAAPAILATTPAVNPDEIALADEEEEEEEEPDVRIEQKTVPQAVFGSVNAPAAAAAATKPLGALARFKNRV